MDERQRRTIRKGAQPTTPAGKKPNLRRRPSNILEHRRGKSSLDSRQRAGRTKIAPAIMAADLSNLHQAVEDIQTGGADLIHVDVMDGHFVPHITVGPGVVSAIKSGTDVPIEVHLMVTQPELLIDEFVKAGATAISVHAEATTHLRSLVDMALAYPGLDVGVALNPTTPLERLTGVLSHINFVLLMCVDPSLSYQEFEPASTSKIAALRKLLDERDLNVEIVAEGGINKENARPVVTAGADVLVAGAQVLRERDIAQAVRDLRQAAS